MIRSRKSDKGAYIEKTINPRHVGCFKQHPSGENLQDIAIGTEIVLGNGGVFPFSNLGGTYEGLLTPHGLNQVASESEAAFVAGHLNGWKEDVCAIIAALAVFVEFPRHKRDRRYDRACGVHGSIWSVKLRR